MHNLSNSVSFIPFGLLTCFVNNAETRITELALNGFSFRTPEPIRCISSVRLYIFISEENRYQEMILTDWSFGSENVKQFYTEYTIFTKQEDYVKYVRYLFREYQNYISLKLTGDDAYLASQLTDYPDGGEEEHYENFEDQKNEWFQGISDAVKQWTVEERQEFAEVMANTELAVELDRPKLQREYLDFGIDDFMEQYWIRNSFTGHPITQKRVTRLYIGNQFCHLLCPERELLYEILEKARGEGLEITLSLSYLRESMVEQMEKMLEELYRWCGNQGEKVEIIVNDWGIFRLLCGKLDRITPILGTLLNKIRKDPRYQYKIGADLDFPAENSLNSGFYQRYLKENLGLSRFEYESCGHRVRLPEGRHSMHLPFYQTNTSQYCTLFAQCTQGARGIQKLPEKCPGYCSDLVFLYPKHLKMIGKYNSLFGYDDSLLVNPGRLADYTMQGLDRIVLNLF